MSAFQMELNDYPHFDLTNDGRLFHWTALPGVPESAIRRTHLPWLRRGCSGLPLPTVHGLDQCEVSVMTLFDPMELWSGSVIGSEHDTDIKLMAHMALTSLWEDRLTATATLPNMLLPIQNQENPIW
jgi:hypothetical protein